MDLGNVCKSVIPFSVFVFSANIHFTNTSLPSGSYLTFPFSYILPLLSAYTYCNAGNNEHDPLSCPSYIIQRTHNINRAFVYPLPLNQSFLFNMYPFTAEQLEKFEDAFYSAVNGYILKRKD